MNNALLDLNELGAVLGRSPETIKKDMKRNRLAVPPRSSPHMINSTHQKSPALGQPFAPVIPLLKNLISPALFSQRVRYTCLDPKREQDLQHIDTRYRGIPLPPAAARFARRGGR